MRICCQSKPVILLLLLAFIITLSVVLKEPEQNRKQVILKMRIGTGKLYPDNPGDRYLIMTIGQGQFLWGCLLGQQQGVSASVRSKLSSRPNRATSQPGGARNPVERPAKPGTAAAGGQQGQQQQGEQG